MEAQTSAGENWPKYRHTLYVHTQCTPYDTYYWLHFCNLWPVLEFPHTPDPWLLQISVVHFSFVRIFKKYPKSPACAIFHYINAEIPSPIRFLVTNDLIAVGLTHADFSQTQKCWSQGLGVDRMNMFSLEF